MCKTYFEDGLMSSSSFGEETVERRHVRSSNMIAARREGTKFSLHPLWAGLAIEQETQILGNKFRNIKEY